MLPHIQTQGDDRQSVQPFHQEFLGDEVEISRTAHRSDARTINLIGNDSARMIGVVNQNYSGPVTQYYNHEAPTNPPLLEWLWPHYSNAHNLATTAYTKQNTIHESATVARKSQSESWLIERNLFKDWFTSTGGPLWIWGKVGCGKTVLFSGIVEHIESSRVEHNRTRLGYYYCRFQNESDEELILILRRWIAQTCDKNIIPKSLSKLYDSCQDSYPARNPTSEELERVLMDILRDSNEENISATDFQTAHNPKKIFLLIDALDELSEDYSKNGEEVFALLNRIARASFHNVFILATSRDRADIRESLKPTFSDLGIDYDAVNDEISLYVLRAIESSPRLNRWPQEIKEAIRSRLADQANGMFLWAALQMRSLRSMRVITDAAIHQLLQDLPKDLNETYDRIFSSIDESLTPKTLSALKWIVLAKRPLFMEELVEACAFKVGLTPYLEPDSERLNSYDISDLLQDLVIVKPSLDPKNDDMRVPSRTHTVVLAHVSLIEYLISQPSREQSNLFPGFTVQEGHLWVARNCLSYLFHFNAAPSEQDNERVLLEYAWYNWEKHVATLSTTEEQGRVRLKAMELYQVLKNAAGKRGRARQKVMKLYQSLKDREKPPQLETQYLHGPASRDLFTMLSLLDWLPHEKLDAMVHALAKPYFHPNIKDFLAENVPIGKALGQLETPKHIRLLYPLPCIAPEEPILCRLQQVRLEDHPEFEALSYPWGTLRKPQQVRVNGHIISITKNLFNIIRTLRARELGQTPWLWADALCINIDDKDERVQQVVLMRQIYADAKGVIMCIVDEKKEDEKGLQLLKRIGSADLSAESLYQDDFSPAGLRGVERIFQSAFWSRAWLVPEFVLSRRGTILAGPHNVSIGVVEKAFQRFIDDPNAGSPLWQLFAVRSTLERARTYIKARTRFQEHGFIDLPELLCWFRRQKASRDRDRIYSLLGLLPHDPPMRDHVRIDYTCPSINIFLDAAIFNFKHHGALNILSHVDSSAGKKAGPTWLPGYKHRRIPFTSCDRTANIFNAGGKSSPRLQITREEERTILKVEGHRIDSVRSTKSHRPTWQEKTSWETFLAGQSFYGYRLSPGTIAGLVVPPTSEEEQVALLGSRVFKLWPDFRVDRRFFLTLSDCLGLGPESMRQEDVVVIFAGGWVPYVLRKLPPGGGHSKMPCEDSGDGCYTFVGECYMSGLMDGEAVEGKEKDEGFWQTFCIH